MVRKIFFTLGTLLFYSFSFSQYKVNFVFNYLPPYQELNDGIYVAGSFNNWNPGKQKYQLEQIGTKRGIRIELPKGMHEFKFTRGSWDLVESGNNGWSTE